MPAATGSRAKASERVRDAIVAATVRIVASEGVAAVTHRRVATEARVSLSSTTWHFATKVDILEAALRWTAEREVTRISEIADRLDGTDFDAAAWAQELADWLLEQVTGEREVSIWSRYMATASSRSPVTCSSSQSASARSRSRCTGCRSSCSARWRHVN